MDNNNNKDLGEKVVKNISKDFRVFNKSRVHTWYAWGIIGLIIGSVIAVAYVANRSGEFTESEAALRVKVVGSVDEGAYLTPARAKNQTRWLAGKDKAVMVDGEGTYKMKGKGSFTTNGAYINQYINNSRKTPLLVEPDGDAWLAKKSGGSYTVDTSAAPTATLSSNVTYTLKAVYVNPNNKRSDIGLNFTAYPAYYAGEAISDASWNAYNQERSVDENGAITVPSGMPFFGQITFTDIGRKNQKYRKNVIVPGATENTTRTYIIRQEQNGNGYRVANVKVKTSAGEVDDSEE